MGKINYIRSTHPTTIPQHHHPLGLKTYFDAGETGECLVLVLLDLSAAFDPLLLLLQEFLQFLSAVLPSQKNPILRCATRFSPWSYSFCLIGFLLDS